MKKALLFIVFFSAFLSIDASSPQHHNRNYVHKKFHHPKDLTAKQSRKIEKLRLNYIKMDRALNKKIRSVRNEMNHCLLREKDNDRYEKLREDMLSLRKKRKLLRKDFEKSYNKILRS